MDGASNSQIAAIVAMLTALPVKPWVRLVIDNGSSAAISNYAAAYTAIAPHANVMWEICDSSYAKGTSLATYEQITSQFLAAFPNSALFEIGNELNGEWLGGAPYSGSRAKVGTANPVIAKAYSSWQLVTAAGKQSALTLYYEPSQTVTPGYDMVPWAKANFASLSNMAHGLNKVLVSYYETDNENVRPTLAQWTTIFQGLRSVFPNAALGFGEIGIDARARSSTLTKAESIMSYYYGLKPGVSNWWGGGFWWYGQEDFIPTSKALFAQFKGMI